MEKVSFQGEREMGALRVDPHQLLQPGRRKHERNLGVLDRIGRAVDHLRCRGSAHEDLAPLKQLVDKELPPPILRHRVETSSFSRDILTHFALR
jgi:hypothetical protein